VPAWITVYLRDPTAIPPVEEINTRLDSDWYTLGEQYGLDEDTVDAFLASLEWHGDEIRSDGRRPLQFWITTDAAGVRERIEELGLPDLSIPAAVRAHLAGVRQTCAIELAFTQLDSMYEAVCFEVAYWLCDTRDGVIRGPQDSWFNHADHRWNPFPDDSPGPSGTH
jgi:hypothetical protein